MHQASEVEGKNSLRKRRDILVSDRYLLYYTTLILINDGLPFFRFYYFQFTKVEIL